MGIRRLSGSKNAFIVCWREETQRHESHIVRIFVTFVLFMRFVYTRCLYRHALYARVYLRRDRRRWPITDSLLMVGIRACILRVPAFQCISNASTQAPSHLLRRDIFQYFMGIIILLFSRSARYTRNCGVSWSSAKSMAAIEFLLYETNEFLLCE